MFGWLCSALAFHNPQFSRRQAVTGFLSATPGLAFYPTRTSAALFGGEGPQAQLAALVKAQADLAVLEAQLESGGIKNSDDDAMVVLRTVAVQQAGIAELMDKVLALSPTLDPNQRSRAAQAASSFGQQVASLKDAARRRELDAQKSAAAAAGAAIGDYLGVLSSKYSIPVVAGGKPYSSDPTTFTAQYFGFFSCEGQGLQRMPGSNNCGDRLTK